MKRILAAAAALLAAGGITVAAVPARASGMFAVIDDGGVLVTSQPVTAGEEIYSGGRAHEVTGVEDYAGTFEFTMTPGLPGSDLGKVVVFSA